MRTLFSLFLLLVIKSPLLAGKADGCLDIYWSDSGGGGSTLIVSPAGESILIDSGNPGGRDSGRILNLITNTAGLDHLDHLIVTHFHIDHFGGAAEIAKALPVRNLWDNGLPETDPDGNVGSGWALTSRAYRTLSAGTRHRVNPGTVIPLRIYGRTL
ncbi:MAG: MBL fold metallo-hydrolase, partial [Pedosphaera sp.]|nr:MBL fold metallo-hydrolase [Pedosphaera sp.]